jgi:hypothetical protein
MRRLRLAASDCRSRLLVLLLDTNLLSARFMLMVASLSWAFALLLPGDGFVRPLYQPMRLIAPEHVWAALFGLHGVSSLIASFSRCRHRLFFFLEPALGLLLYSASTLSVWAGADQPAPLLSCSFACMAAAFWLVARYPEKPRAGT